MSRVAQLLTLAGVMFLALGAVPKPVKQPPRLVLPVQSAYGQITQVNVAAGKLTVGVRSFVPGAAKVTSQTFAISNSTPVAQGMLAQPKELRAGDKVIVNYSESAALAMRHPFGDYPHLNAYGEVTKTSPLTVKVGGGLQLVISGSSKATFQRDCKLSTKDLRPGWQVGVVSHKTGGRAVAEQIRVTSSVASVLPIPPKPKPKTKP